jgi:hypothetical protein
MRRLLIPAALALAAVAAVAALSIRLADVYNTPQVDLEAYASGVGTVWLYNIPRGVWMGPYVSATIMPLGGSSLVVYVAVVNPSLEYPAYVKLNDVWGWRVYLNGTEAASPAYRITPIESNATHQIYRIEVRVPDVRELYVYRNGASHLYIKLP